MSSKPVLSEENKVDIREKLQEYCELFWTKNGYKKTSVKELCSATGISIGTFYTLYPTKEDLFFETVKTIQDKLKNSVSDIIRNNPGKEGFALSIKELFREYGKKPFLYNVGTPDFQSFASKLPNEEMEEIKFDSIDFFRKSISESGLKLKINEFEAYVILSALLSTITSKDNLSTIYDYATAFDFMVDNLMPHIFH